MAVAPLDRSNMYLVDESGIREKNDAFILASAELKEHLDIINKALHLISSVPNLIVHTTDDELVAQRLMVRCFNSGASSLLLARSGYYQPALTEVRDLVETSFLLDLFSRDPPEIKFWWSLPANEREKRFKPWKVRKRLDDLDGNKLGLRGQAYKNLSTYAAHPTPEGFNITSPKSMTQIGPFPDEDRVIALLQELARNLSYAALVIGNHTPHNEMAFMLKMAFVAPFNLWRLKYIPGSPRLELDEHLEKMGEKES